MPGQVEGLPKLEVCNFGSEALRPRPVGFVPSGGASDCFRAVDKCRVGLGFPRATPVSLLLAAAASSFASSSLEASFEVCCRLCFQSRHARQCLAQLPEQQHQRPEQQQEHSICNSSNNSDKSNHSSIGSFTAQPSM